MNTTWSSAHTSAMALLDRIGDTSIEHPPDAPVRTYNLAKPTPAPKPKKPKVRAEDRTARRKATRKRAKARAATTAKPKVQDVTKTSEYNRLAANRAFLASLRDDNAAHEISHKPNRWRRGKSPAASC